MCWVDCWVFEAYARVLLTSNCLSPRYAWEVNGLTKIMDLIRGRDLTELRPVSGLRNDFHKGLEGCFYKPRSTKYCQTPRSQGRAWNRFRKSQLCPHCDLKLLANKLPDKMLFCSSKPPQFSSVTQSCLTLCDPFWGQMKVKVTEPCPALCDSMDYTVHGILQARILEWVAFSFSRGSSWPRNQTRVFCIAGRFFTNWAMRKAVWVQPIKCLQK